MVFTKGTKVSVDPASEPLTTTEAKNWLKVDYTTDDTIIDALIAATRSYIESSTGLALYTQTVTDVLDDWPDYENVSNPWSAFHLMRYPVQSVSSIQYYDGDGVQQTLDSSKYIVDTTGTYCRIAPAESETWPTLHNRMNAVTVTYIAGWADVADIPADLTTAMRLMLTYFYERRADSVKQYKTMAEHLIANHYVPVK